MPKKPKAKLSDIGLSPDELATLLAGECHSCRSLLRELKNEGLSDVTLQLPAAKLKGEIYPAGGNNGSSNGKA